MSAESPPPQSIVWLASYPKSGNTWLRAMLTHLLDPADRPLDLSDLVGGAVAENRHAFDDICGIDSAEFSYAELLPYRSIFHHHLALENPHPCFVKTHDMFVADDRAAPMFPAAASAAVIYLVRDPRDVAVSFAHHAVANIETTIERMADSSAMLNQWPDRISPFLPVRLGSWSDHVESWTGQNDIPLLLLRYEDMLDDPVASLGRVTAIAGLDVTPAQCAAAVEATRFERLQSIERATGFVEKPANAPRFFRAGKSGGWRDVLTPNQVERIVSDHRATMERCDYRTDFGTNISR